MRIINIDQQDRLAVIKTDTKYINVAVYSGHDEYKRSIVFVVPEKWLKDMTEYELSRLGQVRVEFALTQFNDWAAIVIDTNSDSITELVEVVIYYLKARSGTLNILNTEVPDKAVIHTLIFELLKLRTQHEGDQSTIASLKSQVKSLRVLSPAQRKKLRRDDYVRSLENKIKELESELASLD